MDSLVLILVVGTYYMQRARSRPRNPKTAHTANPRRRFPGAARVESRCKQTGRDLRIWMRGEEEEARFQTFLFGSITASRRDKRASTVGRSFGSSGFVRAS